MSMTEIPRWKCIKCKKDYTTALNPQKCACGGEVMSEREYYDFHNYNYIVKERPDEEDR